MTSGGPARELTLDEIVERLPVCSTNGKRHRAYDELIALRDRVAALEVALRAWLDLHPGCEGTEPHDMSVRALGAFER